MNVTVLKSVIFAASLLFAWVTTVAAERYHIVKGEVTALEVNRGLEVDYYPGTATETSVSVKGPQKYVHMVQVTKRGGTLRITINLPQGESNSAPYTKELKLTVKGPAISSFTTTSGSEIDVKGTLMTGGASLTVNASSGSEISFGKVTATGKANVKSTSGSSVEADDLSCNELRVETTSGSCVDIESAKVSSAALTCTSGSKISIEGAVTKLVAEASSGSSISLDDMSSREMTLRASGSSKISASGATGKVSATATSTSVISLKKLRSESTPVISTSSLGKVRQ